MELADTGIYAKRCLSMISWLNQYIPRGVIEIPRGSGGMFLWIRLMIENHPDYPTRTAEEIGASVFQSMITEKILCVPSVYFKAPSFAPAEDGAKKTFMRISFALPPPDEMEEGVRRMAVALSREWRL